MSVLSDWDIRRFMTFSDLIIDDMKPNAIQPASVDLYLDDSFAWGGECERADLWYLRPQEFILGSTIETVSLPGFLAGQVHGCSSVGRRGIVVQNAGWVDPGFSGQLTLEIYNMSNLTVTLTPGMRICQISFHRLLTPTTKPYCGRYQHQSGATSSIAGND